MIIKRHTVLKTPSYTGLGTVVEAKAQGTLEMLVPANQIGKARVRR